MPRNPVIWRRVGVACISTFTGLEPPCLILNGTIIPVAAGSGPQLLWLLDVDVLPGPYGFPGVTPQPANLDTADLKPQAHQGLFEGQVPLSEQEAPSLHTGQTHPRPRHSIASLIIILTVSFPPNETDNRSIMVICDKRARVKTRGMQTD
ncbi:hypothetical protein FHL15_002546 [Xylaria flabelliformis]|uniref:Uncharacterized protein n=1 Tax=Xylaria flabelliformis TaxID=2512241 RepID=A0A553I8W6_9PEZI|nr:hypothetical protein FHL15_002546 [Xylaria flabelliformis]